MAFEVIPAIDVSDGALARWTPSGPIPVRSPSGGDPLAVAATFVRAGVRWVHVVDMDLAFGGQRRNVDVVRAIAAMPVRVQASGGIGRREDVEARLAAGAARVVVGSGALSDLASVGALVAEFGDQLAVGLDVADGATIRSRGPVHLELPLAPTLERLGVLGVTRLVVTSLGRVGALAGPDVAMLGRVAAAVACPLVAAGGIASVQHLEALRAIDGVEGAIIGRALLEGDLTVEAALDVGR
jgi:phosphoribosyl isomerase A